MSGIAFSGPWSRNMDELGKGLAAMPAHYHAGFMELSADATHILCHKSYLHVWETDSDIDDMLQLTQVIVKVRAMSTYVPQGPGKPPKNVPAGMVIIVESVPGRDNFARICALVRHLMDEDGHPHLHGTVMTFRGIKVVKGVDNSRLVNAEGSYISQEAESEARKTLERVNKAITRAFESGAYPHTTDRKIVWHHGPALHFLNFWINNTTHTLRSSLAGVTIQSLLSLSNKGIAPGPKAMLYNKLQDLKRLEKFCNKLNIKATILDTSAQLIAYEYLATYLYFHPYYINTFLPKDVLKPHLQAGMDELVRWCFQLRAACEKAYNKPDQVVKKVQSRLSASKAKAWAKTCINLSSYAEKSVCQAQASDHAIHNAVQNADSPFKQFEKGVEAFSRLTLGPAAELVSGHYAAVPISIQFDAQPLQIRVDSSSPWRVWLPTPDQDAERVTQRVRGVMMGVLELVRTGPTANASGMGFAGKGMPVLGSEEKAAWAEVRKACLWALEGCKGKLPNGVEDKVAFVERMLKAGTWTWCLGLSEGGVAGQEQFGQSGGWTGTGAGFGLGANGWTGTLG